MSTTDSTIRIGDMVKITDGLGKGQIVRVEGLKDLPMGTGVVVTLAGDERATLNPANLEFLARADDDHLLRIRRHLYACVDDTLDVNSAAMIQHHAEALAAELEAERARVARLQRALRAQNQRMLERRVYDELNRRDGELPSQEWTNRMRDTILSNLYAIDGMEPGDLPDEEATR